MPDHSDVRFCFYSWIPFYTDACFLQVWMHLFKLSTLFALDYFIVLHFQLTAVVNLFFASSCLAYCISSPNFHYSFRFYFSPETMAYFFSDFQCSFLCYFSSGFHIYFSNSNFRYTPFRFPIYTSICPHKHVFVHPSTSSQYTHISVFECPIALPRGTKNAPCFKSLDIQL